MITTPHMSASGSDAAATHRKTRLVILLTEPLYRAHRRTIEELQILGFNVPIMEELLLAETLGDGSFGRVLPRVAQGAYGGADKAPDLPANAQAFAEALMSLMLDVWQRSPYNHPDTIIYQARRHGYHANNLALEISYRDPFLT